MGEQASLSIPIIDFGPLESPNVASQSYEAVGKQVYDAFKHYGFAYIKNHGVPQKTIEQAFEWSRKFFSLPQEEKDKVPHPPEAWHHRGYSSVGLEKVSQMIFDKEGIAKQRSVPDSKESFDLGREDDVRRPNIWPDESVLPGFRSFMLDFHDVCYQTELRLLRAIAVGMDLDTDYFVNFHQSKENQIRLLHYPSIEEHLLASGKVDCIGAHTDFGSLTMLFQDSVGGLEVEDIHEKGKFNPAPYIDGTIVCNIGDFLMRWSNDELKSTLHHVRTPPAVSVNGGVQMTQERYSIPYFITADHHRTIDCLPGCWSEERPKKYEPINARQYIDMRMAATY